MSCFYYFKQLFLHAPSNLDQDVSKIEFIIAPWRQYECKSAKI